MGNALTKKTYLQLVQEAIKESGVSQSLPETTMSTSGMTPRFVAWVKQAYEELQGERQWNWRRQSHEFLLPRGFDIVPTGRTDLGLEVWGDSGAFADFDLDFTSLYEAGDPVPDSNFALMIRSNYPVSSVVLEGDANSRNPSEFRANGQQLLVRKREFIKAEGGNTTRRHEVQLPESYTKSANTAPNTSSKYELTMVYPSVGGIGNVTISLGLPCLEQLIALNPYESDEGCHVRLRELVDGISQTEVDNILGGSSEPDAGHVLGLGVPSEGQTTRATFIQYEQWRSENVRLFSKDPGVPNRFTLGLDDELRFNRPAHVDLGVDLDFTVPIETLQEDTDTTIVPTRYQDIIIWRAVMYYAQYDETTPTFQRALERYRYYKKRMEEYELPQLVFKPADLFGDYYH